MRCHAVRCGTPRERAAATSEPCSATACRSPTRHSDSATSPSSVSIHTLSRGRMAYESSADDCSPDLCDRQLRGLGCDELHEAPMASGESRHYPTPGRMTSPARAALGGKRTKSL